MGTALSAYFAFRLYPGLRFQVKNVKNYFRPLLRYGLNLQLSRIAVLINFQFDKLLVNQWMGAAHVTFYEIGSRPAFTLRSFPAQLLSVLTPASSELEVRKGKVELYELFFRASKYVALLAFPLFIGTIVTGHSLIEAWVGPGYDMSVGVLRILCIGYLFNIIAGPVSPLVQGMGRPALQRNAEFLNLLLNVALSVLLIRQYGFFGAPIGTAIAMSVASVYYLWSFHHFMERPLLPFLKAAFLKPALCAGGSGLLTYAITSALTPYAPSGRSGALLILSMAGCICVCSYMILILTWRYLDDRDMALLQGQFPILLRFLKFRKSI
jgi:O-antigen/teichoic acid export membrane protein